MDTVSWGDWVEQYQPVTDNQGEPRLFETYGEDLAEVLLHDEDCIWTLFDDGETMTNGYRIVNRLGYYLTRKPMWYGMVKVLQD